MCAEVFHPAHVTAIEGDRDACQALLDLPFDKIFFTGGTTVGRIVMEAAAKNLTPVTLELGGKSPCIVDQSANIKLAAKRIIWGKLINAGQTCVAPDYILAHESIKDKLIQAMLQEIRKQYGQNPSENPNYPKIINDRHYQRLNTLIGGENIMQEGNSPPPVMQESNSPSPIMQEGNSPSPIMQVGNSNPSTLQLAPTIIDNPSLESPVMQEEIFGPILPILTFSMPVEAVKIVRSNPKPLALYIFTSRKAVEKYYLKNISFGGGCINDTVVHLSVPRLPFGGVGQSGMGSCHGKAGFDAFTHYRSVLHKSKLVDIPLRYPPYTDWALKILKML